MNRAVAEAIRHESMNGTDAPRKYPRTPEEETLAKLD